MEEYNTQIRDPNDDNIKQWAAVRQPRLQGLLFKPRHQEPILIPKASQANGQAEVTNRTLLKIIKAKLDDAKGNLA